MAIIDIELPDPPEALRAIPGLEEYFTQLQTAIGDIDLALRAGLREGDPTHPEGGSAHPNGLLHNMEGSWVTVSFTALDTATTVTHNLELDTTGTASANPNVVWRVMGIKHSGVGATAVDSMSVNYEIGDAINTNDIELRLYSGGTRTVSGAQPATVLLWLYGVDIW